MHRFAVCDDDKATREEVRSIVLNWKSDILVDCYKSGEELIENYKPYQAVFLDIDMEGMDGIDTGRELRKRDKAVKIIYLTAYREYAAGAFQVHAFQYLLKPVKEKEIQQVLWDVCSYLHAPVFPVLDFHTGQGLVCLPADAIYYFEYLNRKVEIITLDGRYTMQEKSGNVAGRMKQYGFSMPHQSFVVNMLHVKNVLTGRILLDNGIEIPLAQKKQKAWKQELISYLSERLEGER